MNNAGWTGFYHIGGAWRFTCGRAECGTGGPACEYGARALSPVRIWHGRPRLWDGGAGVSPARMWHNCPLGSTARSAAEARLRSMWHRRPTSGGQASAVNRTIWRPPPHSARMRRSVGRHSAQYPTVAVLQARFSLTFSTRHLKHNTASMCAAASAPGASAVCGPELARSSPRHLNHLSRGRLNLSLGGPPIAG